ncbi:MAG: T9SS type B sorting domain-containing protein [Chitinophagaceae bacterium]|nr:MAG: T9SS type B sorting domain-containing protein [Chitinophagaceae bacterium]
MKKTVLLLLTLFLLVPAFASHLKGGFFTYQYVSTSNGFNRYDVRLTVYMDPSARNNTGQLTATIPLTIYNNDTRVASEFTAFRTDSFTLRKKVPEDCITNSPVGDFYLVVIFEVSVDLPTNSLGHTIAYQRCCRITNIANIFGNSASIGNTYSVVIPGTQLGPDAPKNNSTTFLVNDTAIICRNSYFEYSFKASDPDADSISYSFCDAWEGGSQSDPAPNVAEPPPYISISYQTGFGGTVPLGTRVTIDPITGLISGIAPEVGEYVVTVCVEEWKNGVLIARNRKELHVKVEDCSAVRASLSPQYVNCKDFNVLFFNNTPDGVNSTSWDFGVPGLTNDTSNLATVLYTYPDTGLYQVKLVVNRGDRCADSTTSTVRVFPGFFPGFRWQGICATKPTQFIDTSRTNYGVVNFWRWDFGDPVATNDTSRIRNPVYTYPSQSAYQVQLIVGTDKGCRDTVPLRTVTILDRPPLSLPFRDTLICNGDTLQLAATGNGVFSWTPNGQMLNPNTPNPSVWPSTTTWYTAVLDDNGCLNRDSIRVRVVNFVTLQMNPDTTICLTDSVQLGASTDGLRYVWRPGDEMNDSTLLKPMVRPSLPLNVYTLTSRIGHCITTGQQTVRTVPYPFVNVSADTTICFRQSVTLRGTTNGLVFQWIPGTWLTNANTLTPIARPPDTMQYVLKVLDTLSGCPKPAYDTVVVNVMPRIFPDAGNDTMVVAGQPVQLHATGGVRYQWVPATGLNRADTSDPIAFYDVNPEYIRYIVRVYDSLNCVDSARVTVRIFRTEPSIFVPTAFTPNGDGRNDVVKPIAVGMREIEYFRVYNRWGELVFETSVNGAGWDGRIKGKEQGTNVFVWIVKAVDFTGRPYFGKGTVTLIK